MVSALDTASEILMSRKAELEVERTNTRNALREIEHEATRIDAALRALKGSARDQRGDRNAAPVTVKPVVSARTRSGSVKDLVARLLREHSKLTPHEIGVSLIASGQLDVGREGSIRTALWQLRKEGLVETDSDGRSSLASQGS